MVKKTDDVERQLLSKLKAPLEDYQGRRIVIWHDTDGSFEEDFDRISADGFVGKPELERPLKFVKSGGMPKFALKRLIYREDTESDFLIYSRAQKDLSPKGLEGNWLADVEFIAEHFQADFFSLLLEELGAADSALEGAKQFEVFFKAADRRKRFVRLMPNAQSAEDVGLGVIGSLLKAKDLTTSQVMKAYLSARMKEGDSSGAEDDKTLGNLSKYGADKVFESYVEKRLGYLGDLRSTYDLAAHILLNALACTLPGGSLDGVGVRILPDQEQVSARQVCLNVVDDWSRDKSFSDDFYALCRQVEQKHNLWQCFSRLSSADLAESEVLPCIDERILVDLIGSMAQGADRVGETTSIVKSRQGMVWYDRVAPFYGALVAAADAARFYRDHVKGFHFATPAEVWKAYTTDWYRMDSFYRKYCLACDGCPRHTDEHPVELVVALEELTGWIDRIYTNWFLTDANDCWTRVCEKQWETIGYVEGVSRQRHFFEEQVVSGAGRTKRTLVIISDALRYEVAVELAERIERDTKGTVELGSMQGVFPSITEFGMAALLPHTTMSYDAKTGVVNCDGLPTKSTEERRRVLCDREPKSDAFQHSKHKNDSRVDLGNRVRDAEIIYVYHNKIDAIGEDDQTEHDVFAACDTTIRDLVSFVKTAYNDLNISRVVITADHGFIYTRDALAERDKVSKADMGVEVVKLGRRYAIMEGASFEDDLFIKINMDNIRGGKYTGLSPRECVRIKRPGSGECYVHGGASLQEMCVPVIQFRYRRKGSKSFVEQRAATLKLLSTSRRVNSLLFRIDLFQPEVVGGKVKPAEYELVMVKRVMIGDEKTDIEVSNVIKVDADMTDPEESARVTRCKFSLVAGRQYNPKEDYFLICRTRKAKVDVWDEKFTIDVAFAPMDDFGF